MAEVAREAAEDGAAVWPLLQEKLLGNQFSCVAAKTAWRRETVVHRHYGPMTEEATTAALYGDVCDFAGRKDAIDPLLASFISTFQAPRDVTEVEFERLVWEQLQSLHDLDATGFAWSSLVDADPASERFGFSVGGHPFFVVGMHPNSSRLTRRFPYPTLVFNSHIQFKRLKERGIYQRIQREVRARELTLQGSINPNLADFGEASEAAQYSGRSVSANWRCPFRPHPPSGTWSRRCRQERLP